MDRVGKSFIFSAEHPNGIPEGIHNKVKNVAIKHINDGKPYLAILMDKDNKGIGVQITGSCSISQQIAGLMALMHSIQEQMKEGS